MENIVTGLNKINMEIREEIILIIIKKKLLYLLNIITILIKLII